MVLKNRREFLKKALLSYIGLGCFNFLRADTKKNIILKEIRNNRQKVPAIGMGTWKTFDVGYNTKKIKQRLKVLEEFFRLGGTVIDSSPMYGSSERVIGKCLKELNNQYNFFSATKVWSPNKLYGKKQIQNSY